jgi:hypothetical protein
VKLNRANVIAALAILFSSAACSDQSPLAPEAPDELRLGVSAPQGSYVISFLIEAPGGLLPIEEGVSVPTGSFLVLKATVRDNAGNLATAGTVTYEFCWAQGDYAPKAACDSGNGRWKRHWSVRVDPVGSLMAFGSCSTPRSIGFRFTYSGKGSGIASGTSMAKDFTWSAP